ncbi:MAG: hypothetical protein GYA24_00380 [Candidatus Lokiarchaeota archaeon]|nr:hypothetical protein [Candidatus Lokiarchaeota archaeon]
MNEPMLPRYEDAAEEINGLAGLMCRRSKRRQVLDCDDEMSNPDKYFTHRSAAR